MGFQLSHQPIGASGEVGSAALVPWDSELFGFPVADFRPGPGFSTAPEAQAQLFSWLQRNEVKLAGASVPLPSDAQHALCRFGFEVAETSLRATHPALGAAKLPRLPVAIRTVAQEETELIAQVAARTFEHGRYHGDPRFPRPLAAARYAQWMRRACARATPGEEVYVVGAPGDPIGFFHVVVDGHRADLRLAGVDPGRNAGLAGVALYAGVLARLREGGVTHATAKFAASNVNVLNLYASFGFRFDAPQLTYHWHSNNPGPWKS